MHMDGQNATVILGGRVLSHPMGISIDYLMQSRVYWCDDRLDHIGSMWPDGSDVILVAAKGR